MTITESTPWLLLVFRLPSHRASQRVGIWRRLRRWGALPLHGSGYLLPNTPANLEQFHWLAKTIRSYKGQASVLPVDSPDDLPTERLQQRFTEARGRDYTTLIHDLKKLLATRPAHRSEARLARLRQRFQQVAALDFFGSPLRRRAEALLERALNPAQASAAPAVRARHNPKDYRRRTWVTRPRPGIDRCASAWLIRRFIDPRARFAFASDPARKPQAVPFDMFQPGGFGHRGDDCTFETLVKEFGIREARVRALAQIVHDADLGDDKFGRREGLGLDRALQGWERMGLSDDELLRRGVDLVEGLYRSLGG